MAAILTEGTRYGGAAFIVNALRKAAKTKAGGITRKELIAKLCEAFPERSPDAIKNNVAAELAWSIQTRQGLTVHAKKQEGSAEKLYFIDPDQLSWREKKAKGLHADGTPREEEAPKPTRKGRVSKEEAEAALAVLTGAEEAPKTEEAPPKPKRQRKRRVKAQPVPEATPAAV